MRSRLDELLPLAEQNDGLVTATQARALGIELGYKSVPYTARAPEHRLQWVLGHKVPGDRGTGHIRAAS